MYFTLKNLYMFRTDKLFILRRDVLLYMQILVRIRLKENGLKLRCHKLKYCVVCKII